MTDLPGFEPDDEQIDRVVVEHNPAATDRSVARRLALQVLYESDSAGHSVSVIMASHLDQQQLEKRTASFLRRLVNGVITHRQQLDQIIQHYAPEWPLQQVAIVDRNILRIAIFEIATQLRTPLSVAIDEAVELADIFGAEGAPRFVNGVLGSLANDVDWLRQTFAPPNGDNRS
jgi:N utilization substance protein B